MKTPNRYKPGQLITIEGKLYRVTKYKGSFPACNLCAFMRMSTDGINKKCLKFCFSRYPAKYIPMNCYLKPVKLCGKKDN